MHWSSFYYLRFVFVFYNMRPNRLSVYSFICLIESTPQVTSCTVSGGVVWTHTHTDPQGYREYLGGPHLTIYIGPVYLSVMQGPCEWVKNKKKSFIVRWYSNGFFFFYLLLVCVDFARHWSPIQSVGQRGTNQNILRIQIRAAYKLSKLKLNKKVFTFLFLFIAFFERWFPNFE